MSTVRDVRITVLGSGTSAGIPLIGCDCAVCRSDDPRDQRLRTSAAIRFTDPDGAPRTILIDASPDLRQQALRHRLDRCDAILFTHNHVDHMWGLDEVRRFNALMRASIDVYAEESTMEALHRVYRHVFEQEGNVNPSFVATLVPNRLEPGRAIELFGLRIEPVRLLHGRLPVLGFRIEAAGGVGPLPAAWCTDVSAVPPESWRRLEGLRTLFLDMLRFRHHPTHLTVDQAVDTASRIGAGATWFVHMNHEIRHAEVDPTLPEGMRLAWDGLEVG